MKDLGIAGTTWIPMLGVRSGVKLQLLENNCYHSGNSVAMTMFIFLGSETPIQTLSSLSQCSRVVSAYLQRRPLPFDFLVKAYDDLIDWYRKTEWESAKTCGKEEKQTDEDDEQRLYWTCKVKSGLTVNMSDKVVAGFRRGMHLKGFMILTEPGDQIATTNGTIATVAGENGGKLWITPTNPEGPTWYTESPETFQLVSKLHSSRSCAPTYLTSQTTSSSLIHHHHSDNS